MVDNRAADERFMSMALEEARVAASIGEVPIGAVVVHEGRVIARAHNRREADEDPSAHAEFAAMMEASRALGRWRLTGCTVYVTLEPCLMCAGLMVNARIDRCVFGAYDPKGGAVGTLYDVSCDERLNHAFDVTPGVLEDECAAVLRAFSKSCALGAASDLGQMAQRRLPVPSLPIPPTPDMSPLRLGWRRRAPGRSWRHRPLMPATFNVEAPGQWPLLMPTAARCQHPFAHFAGDGRRTLAACFSLSTRSRARLRAPR